MTTPALWQPEGTRPPTCRSRRRPVVRRSGRSPTASSAHGTAIGTTHWFTHRMDAPLPGSGPEIDPNEPVPDDAAELLPDAPEPLPPPPIESTPDDPGGDPGGVPEPA